MAEASQERTTLDRRSRVFIVNRIFQLIEDNSLDGIKQIFGNLPPTQCIEILNFSIDGVIPLYVAVSLNNIKISRHLLKLSLIQGPREMCENWKNCQHPLAAAFNTGNQELIELILQNLYDINDNINGPLSPLMISTLIEDLASVKLIVAMGADINRPSYQQRVPLMYSTSNSEICSFLLSKGANVNQQDEEGFTALHLAVLWNYREGIHHLLKAGAAVRIRSRERITPLIAAIINLDMTMIQYFLQEFDYSNLDRIEALELHNACLCTEKPIIVGWLEALEMRERMNLPKDCQIPGKEFLDFSPEFTTAAELENLKDNPLYLAFQSILVVERILGRNNRLYTNVLLQTASIAIKDNNMEKVRQLIDHVQEICQEASFVAANLSYFLKLFSEILEFGDPKIFFEFGGFTIFKIIAHSLNEMWIILKDHIYIYPFFEDRCYSDRVDAFLYMTAESKKLLMSQEYIGPFGATLKTVLEEDIRVRHHQSLLHRAIKYMREPVRGSIELIETLLEFGADANSKDYFRRTPLMYALKYVPADILNDVLALLVKYDGHSDYRNRKGFRALDDSRLWSCLITQPRS